MPKLLNPPSRQPRITPWLVLMFLFTLNFMSAQGYIMLILMAAYLLLHLREFSFRMADIFLFLFGVEYVLFYIFWYGGVTFREMCNFLVAPWLLYWIGRNLALHSKQDDLPLQVATVLAAGFFAYALLCIVYSLAVAPPVPGGRVMYKYWDHTQMAVTLGGLLLSMATGISLGQLTAKTPGWKRLIWLAVLGVSIFFSFTWAHRTSIAIIGVVLVCNFLAFLFAMNIPPVRKFALLAGFVLLTAIGLLCLVLDVGGCWSWLKGQWLFRRLTDETVANSLSRLTIWDNFFQQWLLYPFGGRRFGISAAYVHNMWLDVYYLCGILPFLALVIATVIMLHNLIRYRRLHPRSRTTHILSNCYLSTFLVFMVEPVLSGYPYIFLAMVLVSGCVEGSLLRSQQQ